MTFWKLLNAELMYNKAVLIYLTGATLLNLLVLKNWVWLSEQTPVNTDFSFLIMGYILFAFLGTLIVSPSWKESRERQHLILPVPACQIAIVQVLRFVAYWISLIILFLLLTGFFDLTFNLVLLIPTLLSASGFSFTVIVLIILAQESTSILSAGRNVEIKKWILQLFIYLAAALLCLLWLIASVDMYHMENTESLSGFLQGIYLSIENAVIFFLVGVLMLFFRILFFKQRKSYL